MNVLESATKLSHAADLMTKEVVTCSPDATLSEAARKMWENDLGFLVVVSGGDRRPVGVITDRDVCMAAYTQGRLLSEIPVRSAMAGRVHTVETKATEDDVLALMRDNQLRRVPVVDGKGGLAGVVGLADIARRSSAAKEAGKLGETVREITKPRREVPRVSV